MFHSVSARPTARQAALSRRIKKDDSPLGVWCRKPNMPYPASAAGLLRHIFAVAYALGYDGLRFESR